MIRAVIGTSPQLTKYDQLHTSLKDQICGTDYQWVRQEYDRLLASLQTQVFSVRNSLAVELKSLEEAQVEETGHLPKEQLHKMKLSKASKVKKAMPISLMGHIPIVILQEYQYEQCSCVLQDYVLWLLGVWVGLPNKSAELHNIRPSDTCHLLHWLLHRWRQYRHQHSSMTSDTFHQTHLCTCSITW